MAVVPDTDELVRRALAYPYEPPAGSFVQIGDRTLPVPPAEVDVAGRRALLAYGANAAPEALTRKLERLRGAGGFTGDAPGGPSRWSTERSAQWVSLKPKLIAEVQYDHVTGDRFRHGTRFLRWRPDKAPRQCTFDQLGREARPSRLIRDVLS